jgi:hypothetical protein
MDPSRLVVILVEEIPDDLVIRVKDRRLGCLAGVSWKGVAFQMFFHCLAMDAKFPGNPAKTVTLSLQCTNVHVHLRGDHRYPSFLSKGYHKAPGWYTFHYRFWAIIALPVTLAYKAFASALAP